MDDWLRWDWTAAGEEPEQNSACTIFFDDFFRQMRTVLKLLLDLWMNGNFM